MASGSKAWDDGSGDKIYFAPDASSGNNAVSVWSDPNNGYTERTSSVTISTTAGSPTQNKTVTVTQLGKDITIITFNDKAITRNDVAIGYE